MVGWSTARSRGDLHGYRVETAEANLFFTFDQVKLVARDRNEAYQKMCATEPGTHVRRDLRLGRWCLENRLPREAAFHLRKVLEVDPTNKEAKDLLTRLEAAQTTGGFVKVGGTAERVVPDAKVVESLARLSPAAVKEFVIGVQPILLARCGSARCHGGPEATSFHLDRVHLAAGGKPAHHGAQSRFCAASGRSAICPPQSALAESERSSRSIVARSAFRRRGRCPENAAYGVAAERRARTEAFESRRLVTSFGRKDRASRQAAVATPSGSAGRAGFRNRNQSADCPSTSPSRLRASFRPRGASQTPEKPANDLGPLTDPFDPTQFNRPK